MLRAKSTLRDDSHGWLFVQARLALTVCSRSCNKPSSAPHQENESAGALLLPALDVTMKGSYINIWIPKGAKVKEDESDSSSTSFGFENPTFNGSDSHELASLGFVPLQTRVEELLQCHEVSLVTRSESLPRPGGQHKVMLQVFVVDNKVEEVMLGLQRSGVGVISGTGFSLIPTAGRTVELFIMHYITLHALHTLRLDVSLRNTVATTIQKYLITRDKMIF